MAGSSQDVRGTQRRDPESEKKKGVSETDSKAEAERKYRRLAWPRRGGKSVSGWANSMCQDPKTMDSFIDYDGYSISSKGFLPTVVDIMVI